MGNSPLLLFAANRFSLNLVIAQKSSRELKKAQIYSHGSKKKVSLLMPDLCLGFRRHCVNMCEPHQDFDPYLR